MLRRHLAEYIEASRTSLRGFIISKCCQRVNEVEQSGLSQPGSQGRFLLLPGRKAVYARLLKFHAGLAGRLRSGRVCHYNVIAEIAFLYRMPYV